MSDEDVQNKESTGDEEVLKTEENAKKANDESESPKKLDIEKPANGHSTSEEDSKPEDEVKEDVIKSKEIKTDDEKDNEEKDSKDVSKSDESLDESKEMNTTEDSKDDSANDTKNESESKVEDEDESMEVSLDESKDEADETPVKPKKKGILEQPVTVRGKRERKKVERYEQETKKEEVVAEGKGTALKDIPYTFAMIQKSSAEDLKILHRIAYSRPGAATEVKKNLYKFKGFPFSREEKAFERKKASIEKVVNSELKKLALIFGLERSGLKGDLVERIIDFLLEPHDLGKKLPKSGRRSSTSKGKKSKSKKKKAKSRKESGGTDDGDNNDDDDDDGDDEDDADDNDDDENENEEEKEEQDEEDEKSESESEDDEPVKKSKKATKATPKRTPQAKKTPQTKKTPKAKAAKTPKSQQKKRPKESESEDDTSEDSDASDKKPKKKVKTSSPTDSEIKAFIKKLLDKADLEEVTMKKLCQQVYDNYPGQDLSHKKDFIKSTVKSILS